MSNQTGKLVESWNKEKAWGQRNGVSIGGYGRNSPHSYRQDMKANYTIDGRLGTGKWHERYDDADGEFSVTVQQYGPVLKSVMRHARKQYKRRNAK